MSAGAYVVSLKYAPGLAKEFCLLGRNLQSCGWPVTLLLDRQYAWLAEKHRGGLDVLYIDTQGAVGTLLRPRVSYLGQIATIFRHYPPRLVWIYNTHPANPLVVWLAARMRPDSLRLLFCHEPYKIEKARYGWRGYTRVLAVEFINALTLRWITDVVLPSPVAIQRFETRYRGFCGRLHECALLVPDLGALGATQRRQYFSYVGRINLATGFDLFVRLVDYVANVQADTRFAVVTPDPIKGRLRELVRAHPDMVYVVNRPRISDDEVYGVIASSFAVLRLDREITQSGVVALAYSAGTPVIATSIPGLVQHVRHKETGYLVPEQPTVDQLLGAIEYVRDHFDVLSRGSRLFYEFTFSEAQWHRYYRWICESTSAC